MRITEKTTSDPLQFVHQAIWSVGCFSFIFFALACGDSKKSIEEKQREINSAKAALETQKAQKQTDAAAKVAPVQLDSFWMQSDGITLIPDTACPSGLWSLFPGEAPGEGEEKKANAAKRKELAAQLKSATYLLKLRGPAQVTLQPFDAPQGHFPLDVLGTIDCIDSSGHVAFAWTNAKAINPRASASKEGAELTQSIWQADPLHYKIPKATQAEAKTFYDANRFGLSARLVLKISSVDVHHKNVRVGKVAGEGVSYGGGSEDWGAGRLVRFELLGIRVATDQEKTELIREQK